MTELLAPQAIGRLLGREYPSPLLRAYGVREIATGIGILASEDPTPWIWGRVAGDVLDIATLAPGLSADNPRRDTVAVAMGLVGAVTAVDIACARSLGQRPPQVYDYSDRAGLSATVLMRRPAPAP